MTADEQLKAWVAGDSKHMGKRPGGECCPDFSCCRPSLQQPEEVRQAYLHANKKKREALLMSFLGAMLAEATSSGELKKKVHLAGRGRE